MKHQSPPPTAPRSRGRRAPRPRPFPTRATRRRAGGGPVIVLGSLAACASLLWAPPSAANEQPAAGLIAEALGFEEGHKKRVEAGEFVWIAQDEETKKQISIAAAAYIPIDLDEAHRRSVEGEVYRVDGTMLAFGEITNPSAAMESLAAMELDREELEALADAGAGSDFNLSPEEWTVIAAVDEGDLEALAQTYRGLLAIRVEKFALEGYAGIPPYAREDDELVNVASELRGLIEADEVLRKDWPELHQTVLGYPKIVTKEPTDSRFFWTVQRIQDRPTVILHHRLTVRAADRVVMVDRQFYAGQSYNALQVISGAFSVGDRTLLMYSNRTSTDQVAGFGSAAAHKIGRGMMAREVEALFDASIEAIAEEGS